MVAEAPKKEACPIYAANTLSRQAGIPDIPLLTGDTGCGIAYITIPGHNVGPICNQ
jgi:hypothetical protein